MKKISCIVLILISIHAYGQNKDPEIEKYKDCQVCIPIIGNGCNKEEDLEIIEKFSSIELVIIKTKIDGTIINTYRGFIKMVQTEFGMSPYFVPTENTETMYKPCTGILTYNCKNTYCIKASCYDEINNLNN